MIYGVGSDIIEISRVAKACLNERFVQRVFTAQEIAYCHGRAPSLAARFAAKEAVVKALGHGFAGWSWQNIEVRCLDSGAPQIELSGQAAKYAEALGISEILITLSHSREYAVAFAVAQLEEA